MTVGSWQVTASFHVFVILAVAACTSSSTIPPNVQSPTMSPTPIPTSMPSPPEPSRVALPFPWTEHGFKVTVLELVLVPRGEHQGIILPENKTQYAIRIQYENLEKETNRTPQGGIGLDTFRLKTDFGNLYDPKYVGGSPMYGFALDPRDVYSTDTYAFNIHADENPTELWGYDYPAREPAGSCMTEEEELLYIFELQS